MKEITYFSLSILFSLLIACNDVDNDLVTNENPEIKEQTDTTSNTPPNAPNDEEIVIIEEMTPCNFDLQNLTPGQTITIDCLLNLKETTIDVPSGVIFEYSGGDITNGTLKFSELGIIDGRLLNTNLQIEGNVSLLDKVFEFIPSRWDIVEGKVDDKIADNNRVIIKSTINTIKAYGGNTFKIDKMDAFFRVDNIPPKTTPTQFAITIPSDFSFIMSENTHIRIQPNDFKQPALLSILDVDNVTISGGFLHGERDEHDYSDGGTHEWETLVSIKGGRNITVSGITMLDSAGDGIGVSNLGHSFDPVYKPSIDVNILNNTFYRNRRNQISLVDGRQILVEGNEFINASIHTDKSKGTAPGFAIDVEAVRGKNPKGPQQIAEDIIIRGNTEKGSRVGSFTVHTGDRVTIEDNVVEQFISYSTSTGTIIRNNLIEPASGTSTGTAIFAGRSDLFERNFDNKVYGNTINGYTTGIEATNTKLEVYENTIINCVSGIRLKDLNNSSIYNNNIKSNRERSSGIVSHSASKYLNDVIIEDNITDITGGGMGFVRQNIEPEYADYTFEVRNNKLMNSGVTVSGTNGFILENNEFNNRIRLLNAFNGTIENNILSTDLDGIRIDSGCRDIKISKNTINFSRNCIWYNNSDATNIEELNNNCKNNS